IFSIKIQGKPFGMRNINKEIPKTRESVIEESLLYRCERGESSPSEERKVKAWLEADATHQKKFEELKKIWEIETSVTNDYTVNTHRAWNRFKDENIRPKNKIATSAGPATNSLRWTYYAAAAVILLAVGLYSFQNLYKPNPPAVPTSQ